MVNVDEYVMKLTIITAIILSSQLCAFKVNASPWASPGDAQLRSDVEILSGYGLISGPVNNWPMSWKQITSGFYKADEIGMPSYVRAALMRVKEKIPNKINVKSKAYYTSEVDFLRGFEDAARGEAEIEGTFEYNLENTSVNVNAHYDSDNESFNLDGSYVSHELGNWAGYIGSIERWWGPGQETTTLLSTNARPMPSIGIRRVEAKAFKTKWLSWVGPWQWDVFVSKMERNRHIPKVVFIGMKFAFEPMKNLEIGLARSLMLCGEGRPCGSKQWMNGLIGLGDLDNIGPSAQQPGNQLAQIDLSYTIQLKDDLNLKFYAEGAAEDLVVILPYTYSRIAGASFYGPLGENGNSWRINAEFSDTTGSLAWLYGEHRKGLMYNHNIYRDGYRYYNKVIGHTLDSDSKYFSLKATFVKANGWEASLKYQNVLINSENNITQKTGNRLSKSREKINSINLNIFALTGFGKIQIDGRIMDNNINTPSENNINFSSGVKWEIGF